MQVIKQHKVNQMTITEEQAAMQFFTSTRFRQVNILGVSLQNTKTILAVSSIKTVLAVECTLPLIDPPFRSIKEHLYCRRTKNDKNHKYQ